MAILPSISKTVRSSYSWVLLAMLGLAACVSEAAAAAPPESPTFFPHATRVYVPRGTAQLLKPYFLSPTPISGGAGWIANSMKHRPRPETWRNRLLRHFVDSGCQGVLIWYLLTMDGGAFYYTSEATEIIAAYEDIFCQGQRCDASLRVHGIKPEQWAAFSHQGKRLVMLLNSSDKEATVRVEQRELQGRWEARVHGSPEPLRLDPAAFSLTLELWGARVVLFKQL